MSRWRTLQFPIQVRMHPPDGSAWVLYSQHRKFGKSADRALAEAKNAWPNHRVELVDLREAGI